MNSAQYQEKINQLNKIINTQSQMIYEYQRQFANQEIESKIQHSEIRRLMTQLSLLTLQTNA